MSKQFSLRELADRHLVERRSGWHAVYGAPDEARDAAHVLAGVRHRVALAVRRLVGGTIVLISDEDARRPWPALGVTDAGGGAYTIVHPLGEVYIAPDEAARLSITTTGAVTDIVVRALYHGQRYGLAWPLHETAVGFVPRSREEALVRPDGASATVGVLAERSASRVLAVAVRGWAADSRVWVDVDAVVREVLR